MTFALLIAVCVAVALASSLLAARSRGVPAVPLVLLAVLVPLGAFAYLQTQARPTRSALAFEVLGQFHSLGEAIRFSDDSTADVVLGDRASASVSLKYQPVTKDYTVSVQRSAEPVTWGGRAINGLPLDRTTRLTRGTTDSLVIKRPWWCWLSCTQYIVHGPGDQIREFELGDNPVSLQLGNRSVALFRLSGETFVSADPRSNIRANSHVIPDSATLRGDSLRIGSVAYAIVTQVGPHRADVLFTRSAGRERWDLPADLEPDARFLVAASNGDTVPGTMYVLNPAEAAPGGARVPYGGFIERTDGRWSWRPAGSQAQAITLNQSFLLSADRGTSGHIVQVQQRDTQPGSALLAVVALWLLGALLLAFLWRTLNSVPLAFRIATIGCLYTLVFVRATITFRAWLAPPHNARVVVVLLSLLIALPALIAGYHYWEETRERAGASLRARLQSGWPVAAFVVVALAIVFPFVLRSWWPGIALNVIATLVVGIGGLAVLQGLLIAPHLKSDVHGPLSSLDEHAARDYTYRQFVTAVAVLAFVGGLFALVAGAIRYGQLIAVAATAAVALGLVWLDASFAPFVRPVRQRMRMGFAAAGALTLGIGVYVTFLSVIGAIIGGLIGAAVGWIAVERPRPRIRPFSLRQSIRPGLLAAVSLGLILLISTGLLGRVRVLVGYALAIAGMIVIVRIFTILWFRESDQAHRISTRQHAPAQRLPSILALTTVLVLTLVVYVPLGLTDPGLVLLFFSAAIVAAMIGLATVGRRGVLLGFGTMAVIIAGFFLVMNVRESTLRRERPLALTTAQTRYAAAIHPDALQQHLVAADVGSAREILNTLQQDWGMQYYAAVGGFKGRGYFGADFLDRGVTTPVALAENSYAVFVLSEHGWIGGVAVLWLYLALVLVLLTAAAFACDQATLVPRALLLSGIAAFWAIPTLYMIAANASLLPLTGQNVPWLGLLSPADAAFGAILGALALHALPRAIRGKPGKALPIETRLRGVRKGIGITALVSIALGVVVSVVLWKPMHQPPDDFRLDTFLARIDELVQNRAIVASDSISVAPSAQSLPAFTPGSFLTRTLRASNSLARGERAASGYCYARDPLLRVTSEGNVGVTRSFCGLGIGTGSRYAWRGSLRAGAPGNELVLTNGQATVLFAQNAREQAVVGSGPQCDVGVIRASSARIGCLNAGARVRFGSSTLTFEPLNGASVQLNAKAANSVTLLQAGDYIASPDGAHFIVTAVPRGAATYSRWQNGGWRRIANPTAGPWLQQLDAQLSRALATRDADNPDAMLTLDPALQEALRTALTAACPRIPGATSCSALFADPVTGAIVGFSDWRAQASSSMRYRALDANLRNHPPASAIKPIVAAAALHAYPKLRQLEVDHDATHYTTIANTSIGDTLRAARLYPNRKVNFNAFIGASDNLYAASLGFLAAGDRGRNELPETRGTGNPSGITIAGVPIQGSPLKRGNLQLERSPLANALEELYGVTPAGAPPQPHDAAFWAGAQDAGVLRKGDDLQRISPEAVTLDLDRIDNPRTLASFMIGGASNRWNNVAMVQAISRLFTGTRVNLYLLESVGDRKLVRAPEADPALTKLKPMIREAMHAVIYERWGTAYTALHTAFDPARVNWVGKTGTLAEPEWTGSAFLFAGEAAVANTRVCPTAGIILVELRRGTNPDGKATAVFRDQLAALLKEHRGWGARPCG